MTCVQTTYQGSSSYFIVKGWYNQSKALSFSAITNFTTFVTSCSTFDTQTTNSSYTTWLKGKTTAVVPTYTVYKTPTSSYSGTYTYSGSTYYSSYCKSYDTVYAYYSYNSKTGTSSCVTVSKAQKNQAGLAGLAALVFVVIILILMFTHCLKRRKNAAGNWEWRCRKATSEKRCLSKRARSYEAHLERQLEKARMMNHSVDQTHDTSININMKSGYTDQTMTTMVMNGPQLPMNVVAPMMVVQQQPMMMQQQPMMMQQQPVMMMADHTTMIPHGGQMMMQPQMMMTNGGPAVIY